MADLVIENAQVITGTPRRARAIAIREGRIPHVREVVKSYVGPKTRHVDARGAAVLPGFIDSHGHMTGLGDVLDTFDLRHEKSACRKLISERKLPVRVYAMIGGAGSLWREYPERAT